jgi:Delta3,5-Delta2,4-dienoyl-CoA isomerase
MLPAGWVSWSSYVLSLSPIDTGLHLGRAKQTIGFHDEGLAGRYPATMSTADIPQSSVLSVDIDGHIATVWLDREEQRNAFAPEFWADFPVVMNALGELDEVRVIVIAARGSAFSVGIDLKAFGPTLMGGEESNVASRMVMYRSAKTLQNTFNSIANNPKPVIAAIHGYCLGAGIDLITACDIRFAASDAIFSVRETRIGMVADVGTIQRLPKIINPGAVADLVYSGRDIDADEALALGLVNRVLENAESVQVEAHALAKQIAANSPLAVQGSKAVLRAGEGRSVEEALDYVALWNSSFITSNDFKEAIMAFIEKREPKFTGT